MRGLNKQNRYDKVKNKNPSNDFHSIRQQHNGSTNRSSKSRLPQPRIEYDDYQGIRESRNKVSKRHHDYDDHHYANPRKRLPAPKKPPRNFSNSQLFNENQNSESTNLNKGVKEVSRHSAKNKENIQSNGLMLPQPGVRRGSKDNNRIPIPVSRRRKTNDGLEDVHVHNKNNVEPLKPRAKSWHNGSDEITLRQPNVPPRHINIHRSDGTNKRNNKIDELPRPGNPHLQEKRNERYSSFVEFTPPETRRNKRYSAEDFSMRKNAMNEEKVTEYPLRLPVPKPRPKSEPPVIPYDSSKENVLPNKDYEKVINAISKMRRSNNGTPEYAVVKKWKKFKPPNGDADEHELSADEHGLSAGNRHISSVNNKSIKDDTPEELKSLKHALFIPDYGKPREPIRDNRWVNERHSGMENFSDTSNYKLLSEKINLNEQASRELKNLKFQKSGDSHGSESDYAYMSPYPDNKRHARVPINYTTNENMKMSNGESSKPSHNLHYNNNHHDNGNDVSYSDENSPLLKKKQNFNYRENKKLNIPQHNFSLGHDDSEIYTDDNDSVTSPGYQSLNNIRKSLDNRHVRQSNGGMYDHIETENIEHNNREIQHSNKYTHNNDNDNHNNENLIIEKQAHNLKSSDHTLPSTTKTLSPDDVQIHTSYTPQSSDVAHLQNKNNELIEAKPSYSIPIPTSSNKNTDESKTKVVKEEEEPDEKFDEGIFETLMLDGYEEPTEQPLLSSSHDDHPSINDVKINDSKLVKKDENRQKESSEKNDLKNNDEENSKCKIIEGIKNYWNDKSWKDWGPKDECPWGRLLGFRKETFEELKKRIKSRTVFVTPSFTDALLDNPYTELNFDKFDQVEENRPSFVSRSFERMDKNPSDICLAEKDSEYIQNLTDSKSGINVKLFCKGCDKFESKECRGPPPEVPPRPDKNGKMKKTSKKEKKKSTKKAPKATKEKSK